MDDEEFRSGFVGAIKATWLVAAIIAMGLAAAAFTQGASFWCAGTLALPLVSTILFLATRAGRDWRRKRPAVISRRKRKQAEKLKSLSEQLAGLVSEIQHLNKLGRTFPQTSSPELLYDVAIRRYELGDAFACWARLTPRAPLYHWLEEWIPLNHAKGKPWNKLYPSDWLPPRKGFPGWDARRAFELALKQQHDEWRATHDKHHAKAINLQERVNKLSEQLGIETQDFLSGIDPGREPEKLRVETEDEPPPETVRAKLAKVRVEIGELRKREDELLAQAIEEEGGSGAFRKPADVKTANSDD